jgi:hypothetical protein
MNALLLTAFMVAADEGTVSCGAVCTYLLVRETRPEVSLAQTAERLADRPEGHSFGDLAAVADSLGVKTIVAHVKKSGRLPRGPFVAHFQDGGGGSVGHFVFFRPLEPTFTQYQMIAAPFEPEVLFASDILARPDFTGWVMTEAPSNLPAWAGVGLLIAGGILFGYSRRIGRETTPALLPRNLAPAH